MSNASPESSKSESRLGSLAQAADRIRESAKWLIASFAAVGGILVAGLQLTGIGKLTNEPPDHRLGWALAGLCAAISGIVIAIAAASSVVTKSFVTLKWLANQEPSHPAMEGIEGDVGLLGGYANVADLNSAYGTAMQERQRAYSTYYGTLDDATDTKAQAAQNWATLLGLIQAHVLEQASFNNLRHSYRKARWGILAGAAITAVGIAAFAWGANPPEPVRQPVVLPQPSEVTVVIKPRDPKKVERQVRELQRRLGSRCKLSAIDAVVLDSMGQSYRVASVATDRCAVVFFTVGPELGRVLVKSK
jgi:hypothetical protein